MAEVMASAPPDGEGGGAPALEAAPAQPLGKDLAITSWTPDDVDLPMVPLPGMQQTKFMSQHTFDERDAKKEAVSAEPKPCTLDGFRLLDVCQVEFPDQARHVDMGGLNAVKVVTEDLAFFSNLVSIDAGRNALPFEPMAAFPNLQSLKMPCNGIRELGGGGTGLSGLFTQLTHLDLSYNMLGSPKNLTELSVLPNLRVLDLTCNGMKTLPPPEELQGGFRRLARLVLERNQIEDPGVLVSCAGLPRLEELHLGYNYLQTVAPEATDPGAFPALVSLSLCFNYFRSEAALGPLALLRKLEMLMLYGNPLLGPTMEDPTGDRIVSSQS